MKRMSTKMFSIRKIAWALYNKVHMYVLEKGSKTVRTKNLCSRRISCGIVEVNSTSQINRMFIMKRLILN
jgi:hypothetical protein